jgi:Icc-related predicted phosphoesterase
MGTIRVAAAGDVHADASRQADLEAAFVGVRDAADLILLAGDLTTHGRPEEVAVVAEASKLAELPVMSVLGNHDWHSNRADEVKAVMQEAGVTMLDQSSPYTTCEVAGQSVGITGTKGFVGGFPGSHLPDFGEPLLREVYAESMRDAAALDEGLRAVRACPLRIVLLHYAPTTETLVGEPEPIWTFLGTDRLAPPIVEHEPDLVLHGHAHAGTFEGRIGNVPVLNVSVPVMQRDFWELELTVADRATSAIH